MAYLIGLDGGGTKTIGLIADRAGNCLGRVTGSATNYHLVGLDQTESTLKSIVTDLLNQINLQIADCQSACFGLAGVGRPDDHQRVLHICHKIGLPARFLLTHDAEIALVAGTGTREGIIAISGTGSIVYGRNRQGKATRTGGWGHLLGDEGSGYDIGLRGLRAVVRMADGRQASTLLMPKILTQISLTSPDQLVKWISRADKSQIAQLANSVFQAAQAGDLTAQEIINHASRELALSIQTVIQQLALPLSAQIVLSGGVFQNQASFVKSMQDHFLHRKVKLVAEEPAYGAILIAQQLAVPNG
ncbi:MAG: BadF/BadG/BcrA/BcrD ATPase family protein [Candidatus Poribacteria bacterium]|jgi:N-acetylglucosamine kinase-like BadF-type ATPase|nr:BadF/BadG/BcrA/BcrD ATPase family protein [Candidatus Poribacteria bacterium]MDP6747091.1 BadF/BadG/BcrA/BcrD ATPase family protein [Candidatus Poribacteria bacterium]